MTTRTGKACKGGDGFEGVDRANRGDGVDRVNRGDGVDKGNGGENVVK